MNKVVKALLLLAVANILIGLYAYGVFLQVPIFQGHPLMLQHILEPIFYVIVSVIGNYLVFKSIYFSDKNRIIRFNELKFLLPVVFLLLTIGVGLGIGGFEGSFNGFNQNYLILPSAAILLYKIYKNKISFALKFWDNPFTAFFTVSLVVYTVFVLIF